MIPHSTGCSSDAMQMLVCPAVRSRTILRLPVTLRIVAVALALCASGARAQSSTTPAGSDADILEHPRRLLLIDARVVVLERGQPFLKVLSLDGRMLQSTGRRGGGPGEFQAPMALAYNRGRRELVVFDAASRRASVYSLRDSLTFQRAYGVDIAAEDACYMGSRLFVMALEHGSLLHELQPQGPRMVSARHLVELRVKHPLRDYPLFREQAGQGVLWCDDATQRVVISSFSANAVHDMDLRRNEQLSFSLRDFTPLDFSAIEGGGLRQSIPSSGEFDETVAVVSTPSGPRVVLGHATLEYRGAGDYAYYREISLGQRGAQGPARRTAWQQVGVSGGAVVCFRTNPAPTLRTFQSSRCP